MNSCVVSKLTADVTSAIATIAVHGANAMSLVSSVLPPRTQPFRVGGIHYLRWPVTEHLSEEVVLCCTDDRTVEIHCHGGNAVSNQILVQLCVSGCEQIDSAQWTERTRVDRPASFADEAQADIRWASTDRVAAILLDQMNGALDDAFREIRKAIAGRALAQAAELIHRVLKFAELGMHLTTPWSVVLAGPPNAGKSSLINSIAGQEHAIVHSEPGTTRDWLEAQVAIEGWPMTLTDTAGIRLSTDAIEMEGVQRAWERVHEADIVVITVDALLGWTNEHGEIAANCTARNQRTLIAWNKCDLIGDTKIFELGKNAVVASSVGLPGVGCLMERIVSMLVPVVPPVGLAVPFREWHVKLLRQVDFALKSQDYSRAIALVDGEATWE